MFKNLRCIKSLLNLYKIFNHLFYKESNPETVDNILSDNNKPKTFYQVRSIHGIQTPAVKPKLEQFRRNDRGIFSERSGKVHSSASP